MKRANIILFFAMILGLFAFVNPGKGAIMIIQKGSQVGFDYTLTVDNVVIDTSEGKEPFEYTHGDGKIIPGLSRQLEGLKVGDTKKITVSPEEGYGQVDPQAFKEVPKTQMPPDLTLQVGMPLQVRDTQGNTLVVKVAELKPDIVVLDLNHPLAGKTLVFDIKIVSIK